MRAGTVFTTHTPVPAGIDRFPRELIEQYFGGDNAVDGVPVERILALGAEDYEGGDPTVFNMAVMGLRLGQRANGVCLLHGEVSRGMFAGLWQGFDADEVPISSITNGVHAATWVAREIRDLLAVQVGPETAEETPGWESARSIPRRRACGAPSGCCASGSSTDVRARLRASWEQRGASDAELGWIDEVLDPDVLTIGFARRVPSYKRLTLMLRDPERLQGPAAAPEPPGAAVIAGKSHPADDGGKKLIQQLVAVRRRPRGAPPHRVPARLRHRHGAAALPRLRRLAQQPAAPARGVRHVGDEGRAQRRPQPVDPRRLVGRVVRRRERLGDPDRRRRRSTPTGATTSRPRRSTTSSRRASPPRFYEVDADGLPTRWITMLRHTLATLGPKVLAARMVREYVTKLYAPAAVSSREVLAGKASLAKQLAAYATRVRAGWPGVRVEHVEASGVGDSPERGSQLSVRAYVALGELTDADVLVELASGRVDHNDRIVHPTFSALSPVEGYDGNRWRYEATVVLDDTGPFGYTVRVLPDHEGLHDPAELGLQALPLQSGSATD